MRHALQTVKVVRAQEGAKPAPAGNWLGSRGSAQAWAGRKMPTLLVALVLALPAAAAEVEEESVAVEPAVEVSFSGPNLVVEPRVPGVATSVYVSCADRTYIHHEFEGAGAALVELVRADGAPVADGRCEYEVYVHPPVDREAMRIAEESGDFATVERLSRLEQQRTAITHGRFLVAGGGATTRDQVTDQ